jgi:GxxExxY protein
MKIIGCAIAVHRVLVPGLLESTYQQCLARELSINNIKFSLEHHIPVEYKGVHLDCRYRIDILIESDEETECRIILELKPVEELQQIHAVQILAYMKLSNISTDLLLNFNTELLTDGIKRSNL